MGHLETGELKLTRARWDRQIVEQPIVKRTVVCEFERRYRVRLSVRSRPIGRGQNRNWDTCTNVNLCADAACEEFGTVGAQKAGVKRVNMGVALYPRVMGDFRRAAGQLAGRSCLGVARHWLRRGHEADRRGHDAEARLMPRSKVALSAIEISRTLRAVNWR